MRERPYDNTVLLSNGDGTFQPPSAYDTGSASPVSIAIADFNRDGKADWVTANGKINVISVLLGSGDGTLPTPVNYGTGPRSQSESVAVVD